MFSMKAKQVEGDVGEGHRGQIGECALRIEAQIHVWRGSRPQLPGGAFRQEVSLEGPVRYGNISSY